MCVYGAIGQECAERRQNEQVVQKRRGVREFLCGCRSLIRRRTFSVHTDCSPAAARPRGSGRGRGCTEALAAAVDRIRQESSAQKASAYHEILPGWRSLTGLSAPTMIEMLSGAGKMRITDGAHRSHGMFFSRARGGTLKCFRFDISPRGARTDVAGVDSKGSLEDPRMCARDPG